MGFRNKKRKRNGDTGRDSGATKKARTDNGAGYDHVPVVKENALFERYYRAQNIMDASEWALFMSTLRQDLPTTLRVTGLSDRAAQTQAILEKYLFPQMSGQKIDGQEVDAPRHIDWYPGRLAWEINVHKKLIRKAETNTIFKKFHNFLKRECETGNITRQELVSMIPPVLLDVRSDSKVLDMCASPGSKTSQMIGFLYRDGPSPTGVVVANDKDRKRCHMLVHQLKRLQSPNTLVINHDASLLPTIYERNGTNDSGKPKQFMFDRILCDVPCSGDGTLRKNVEVWDNWKTNSGLVLHALQLRIFERGLQMLDVGGIIVYSTCSFNPLENEAVVAAALMRHRGALELIDTSDQLSNLKRRPGLKTWKVLNNHGAEFETYESCTTITDNGGGVHRHKAKTMWPHTEDGQAFPDDLNLERCTRILPHDQNTGGFFICALRKTAPITRADHHQADSTKSDVATDANDAATTATAPATDAPGTEMGDDTKASISNAAPSTVDTVVSSSVTSTEASKGTEGDSKAVNNRRSNTKGAFGKHNGEEPFRVLDPTHDVHKSLVENYGLTSALFKSASLFVRTADPNSAKTVYLLQNNIKTILEGNGAKFSIINGGLKVFSSATTKDCNFPLRLSQEGIDEIAPYMSKRKFFVSAAELKLLLEVEMNPLTSFSETLLAEFNEAGVGPVALTYDPSREVKNVDTETTSEFSHIKSINFSGWFGNKCVRLFIKKDERKSLVALLLDPQGVLDDEPVKSAPEKKSSEAPVVAADTATSTTTTTTATAIPVDTVAETSRDVEMDSK